MEKKKGSGGGGGGGEEERRSRSEVSIEVKSEGMNDVKMKMKRDVKLGRVMRLYVQRMGLQRKSLRFTFDGRKIDASDTPLHLHFQDGDVIDVWSDQTGG